MFEFFHPDARVRRLSQIQGEANFLAGRHSRTYEFFRVVRIALEFIRGFRVMHFTPPGITVFGSARFKETHPVYAQGVTIGRRLAEQGFCVITGGGPGVMEAANRGAHEAGGRSIGLNIVLPHEQSANRFCDTVVTFYYFFIRKVMLIKYSYAYIILPGGFGTLDEMSEALTLIQTGKLYDFPVILVGSDYWKGFLDWLKETLLKEGTIKESDLDYLTIVDDPEEAIQKVCEVAKALALPLKRPKP
ncbi:MAG: TIGR00730 family Rossman fold protein [Bdellovibrionales bacterium]|nr:TIGR00730 family Rossman fold protein [Bdellovibrionales bacterium]